jgi:hypothetical protein
MEHTRRDAARHAQRQPLGVARYLDAIEPRSGLALAELLWLIGGHGDTARIQGQAHRLLKAMNIDGVT